MLPAILNRHPVLPKELEDIFEEYTEDDYSLYVTKAEYFTDKFLLDFSLDVQDINDKGSIYQEWTIQADRQRKTHISFDFAPFIEFKEEHPLLWEFTDIQCQLYFNGQCNDFQKLFYDLYQTHKQLFGQYLCFSIPFAEETSYLKPFQYTNGLLTKGPKKLMEKYGECLKKNGLTCNFIGERQPMYWDGNQYIPETKDLKIMFIGNTYIIAEEFSFRRNGKNSR